MAKPSLNRYAMPMLLKALKNFPVVLIQGPRQCGKTTLGQMVNAFKKKYAYMSFDNEVTIETAKSDPIGFIDLLPKRIILDEVQKAPFIFSRLKTVIDQNRVPGRFILTGSANILRIPNLTDSLAGRMHILRLHPFSQDELLQEKSLFLKTLFQKKFKIKKIKKQSSQVIKKMINGSYPPPLKLLTKTGKANWYKSYIQTIIQRDIMDFSKIRSIDILPRLLALSAAQTSRLINFSRLSSHFQVTRHTIMDYIALLEHTFFLERLQPWFPNRSSRIIKTPKLHLGDTGVASSLLNINEVSLKNDPDLSGQLFETFIFQELKKQASYNKDHHQFFYYRDKKGHEVDIIIEKGRLIAGIEVKSAATVYHSDFKSLRKLKKIAGKNFVCGAVIYNGDIIAPFGQGLYALPVECLWENI